MSVLDKIHAELTLEMCNLEDFVKTLDTPSVGTELKTKEVVIRYTLKGVDHFLVLEDWAIFRLMEERAKGLRKELFESKNEVL